MTEDQIMELVERAVEKALEQEREKLLSVIPQKRVIPLIEKIVWFLGAVGVVIVSIISTSSFTWKYFGEKAVHSVVAEDMEKHNESVKLQMQVVSEQLDKKYASKPEIEAYVADKERKWAKQEALNEQMMTTMTELRADVKELLRRVR